jgi:hypothetical protein
MLLAMYLNRAILAEKDDINCNFNLIYRMNQLQVAYVQQLSLDTLLRYSHGSSRSFECIISSSRLIRSRTIHASYKMESPELRQGWILEFRLIGGTPAQYVPLQSAVCTFLSPSHFFPIPVSSLLFSRSEGPGALPGKILKVYIVRTFARLR